MQLPACTAQFRNRIDGAFGKDGRDWLDNLPLLLDRACKQYDLTPGHAFEPLSYNYVTLATTSDGRTVVLKLGVPRDELTCEIAALVHYDGVGAVRLLEAAAASGLLVLERLQPGHELILLDDDREATRIAVDTMKLLHRSPPAGHSFPSVVDWGAGFHRLRARFDGATGPFPAKTVDRAERQYSELSSDQAPPVLLHGDLHHFNIISAQRAPWLALDPKGVVGEPAFEVGTWMRNPYPAFLSRSDRQQVTEDRFAIFAESLEVDRNRLRAWAYAQAVLSAWWSFEDGQADWRADLELAELFR